MVLPGGIGTLFELIELINKRILYETKKKVEQKKIELKDLSNKFRELKSLVYDYRDKKENEINELNNKHNMLKLEIEDNKKNYEKLIDEAADEISEFVEKVNLENISK